MRKTSYVVAFFAVLGTMILNILSVQRSDWLVVRLSDIIHKDDIVTYGLSTRCELRVLEIPGPNGGTITYTNYECRPFPMRVQDGCEEENKTFCMIWSTSRYFGELGVGFAVVACLAILFGVTTHSRRRRIWKTASALVVFHVLSQIVTFGVVTELYRRNMFPTFERARPGFAYVLNIVSWVLGLFVTIGIIITGNAARAGHPWAAGNRAYRPISG
ncbi:hypothetical protein V8D89_012587 [Ganoderma adspersum]